jgi:hypothetical protein
MRGTTVVPDIGLWSFEFGSLGAYGIWAWDTRGFSG